MVVEFLNLKELPESETLGLTNACLRRLHSWKVYTVAPKFKSQIKERSHLECKPNNQSSATA